MASSEVTDIMSGPLVQWLASCLDDPKALASYDDLVDGVLMYQVFRQIDPEPFYDGVLPTSGDPTQRVKNLQIIFNNLKQFYEEELGHLIIKPPNTTNLGREPLSHVQEARLILLLLLGCAVQCPIKEKFVTKIKNLDLKIQLEIVDCIKQVTDQSDIVINQDTFESANITGVFEQIKQLIEERDLYKEKLTATLVDMKKPEDTSFVGHNKSLSPSRDGKNYNFAEELADSKLKLREQRQILDEKTEALLECQEELGRTKTCLVKIKQENIELTRAARTVQSYKDELDAITERAERADRLEVENQRYREKLADLEFYKTRMEDLRNENQMLSENRGILEEEVRSLSRNTEKIKNLQARLNEYEKLVDEMSLEQSAGQEKFNELFEENCELHRFKKAAVDRAALAGLIDEEAEPAMADSSLSEQLANNAEARVLKLELDNRRLMAIIDSLEQTCFNTTMSRIIELQREKNQLSAEIDSINYDRMNLSHSKRNFETLCKEALEENKKLQNILNQQKKDFEQQQEHCQSQLNKIIDIERNYEAVVKEKQKVQLLFESAQKRVEELERSLEKSEEKLKELKNAQLMAKKYEALCRELEAKLKILEKEKNDVLRNIEKLYGTIENKDMALDKSANTIIALEQKVKELDEKIKNLIEEISRLQEVEELYKKLASKSKTLNETVKILETKLVIEKLDSQQLSIIFKKLGLKVESLLNLPLDTIIERIRGIPEVIDTVNQAVTEEAANVEKKTGSKIVQVASITKDLQEKINSQKREMTALMTRIQTAEALAEQLKSENANLQVSLSTLQSQSISHASEHTTLQLTNAHLTVEKEEMMKNLLSTQRSNTQLVNEKLKLQSLNEQLKNESENSRQDRESLKESLREATTALRTLQETCQKLQMENISNETAIKDANTLKNLNVEHEYLKEDFLLVFNSVAAWKAKYAELEKNYESIKDELRRMYAKNTEMQEEYKSKSKIYTSMELELTELRRSGGNLLESYKRQEEDRRALMDHVTLLNNQYHELLIQSFEDREHHHMEERMYIERLNQLFRQKEKLEEKIMDQYKNMGNSPAKKKTFGANLVKKVRKAGSELLSKNRRSWAEDLTKQLDNNKTSTSESESGGVDSEPTKQLNNNKRSTSESESGGVDSEPTEQLNNNKTTTSESESGGVDSEPTKVLDNNKMTTSESESVGTDSESSIDYKRESVTEFGNSAVLEDKICRWVIEKN